MVFEHHRGHQGQQLDYSETSLFEEVAVRRKNQESTVMMDWLYSHALWAWPIFMRAALEAAVFRSPLCRDHFRLAISPAQAFATPEPGDVLPGIVAQPAFSTNEVWS
jgi:hypothetical protein